MRAGAARAALLNGRSLRPSLVLNLQSGVIDPRLAFSRAGAGSLFDATGTFQTVAANVPRFDYGLNPGAIPLGLLIEEQRTNGIRNPRAEGIVAGTLGSGGFIPANWARSNSSGGIPVTVAPISYAGMTGMRITYAGTTTTGGAEAIEFDTRTTFTVTNGTIFSGAFYYRFVGGALPAQAVDRIITLTSGGAAVDAPTGPLPSSTNLVRISRSLNPSATAATATYGFIFTLLGSTTYNFTIDVFFPQIETGPMPTSIILPPMGSPAASTRAADIVSMPIGAALGPQTGSLLVQAMSPYIAVPSGAASRVLGQISDGAGNLIQVRHNVSDVGFAGTITNAGSGVMNAGSGSLVAGVAGRALVTYSRSKSVLYTNGAAGVLGTGGITTPMPAGMSLSLGMSPQLGGTSYLDGYVQRLEYYPREMSSAEAMQRSIPH